MISRFFSANPLVFLQITIDEIIQKKLVFELQADVAPKTCENFKQLCLGTSEVLAPKNRKLSYKESKIHRIIPGFLCQGGDIMKMNGKGGWSIYGQTFHDENFVLKHSGFGMLSMANSGPNTNNSQFFITFNVCAQLDGKHTVFGKLVEGEDLLRTIESLGTANGKPRTKVIISDCGLVNG